MSKKDFIFSYLEKNKLILPEDIKTLFFSEDGKTAYLHCVADSHERDLITWEYVCIGKYDLWFKLNIYNDNRISYLSDISKQEYNNAVASLKNVL